MPQVRVDRVRRDEQLLGDLSVRPALDGEPRHRRLGRCERAQPGRRHLGVDDPTANAESAQPLPYTRGVPHGSGVDIENQSPVEGGNGLLLRGVVQVVAAEVL